MKASHRIIKNIATNLFGQPKPKEEAMELIVTVFNQAKGSWEDVFLGSTDAMNLLKKVILVAIKKGYLKKDDP